MTAETLRISSVKRMSRSTSRSTRRTSNPRGRWDFAEATVIRDIEGCRAASRSQTARIFKLSEDLPLAIEMGDTAAKIDGFVETVDHMIHGALITIETMEVRMHRANTMKGPRQ